MLLGSPYKISEPNDRPFWDILEIPPFVHPKSPYLAGWASLKYFFLQENPNIFVSEEPMQNLVTRAAFFLVEKKGPQKREKKPPG